MASIISSAICDKQGKILIARQFEQISKHNLEENIRTFPKMIQNQQQHTFVENEYVRYVYMPLDDLYLVLITSKNSNIIEHQETIRLLYKIILDLCPDGIFVENIQLRAFDIILAFDDVISFGQRESISMAQVQNALEMESSEEKLHAMLMQARINEAKENAAKHQQEQLKKQKELKKGGYGIQPTGSYGGNSSSLDDVLTKPEVEEKVYYVEKQPPTKPTTIAPKKGMQLGKKKPSKQVQKELQEKSQQQKQQNSSKSQNELEEQINKEEAQKQNQAFDPLKEPVNIDLVEKFSVKYTRDGTIGGNLEVAGFLYINVLDPSKTKTQIALDNQPNEQMKNVKLIIHPSLNKQLWSKGKVISLNKPDQQSFPVNQKVQTLKYKYTSSDNEENPFNITYWFDETVIFEIEFNSTQNHFKSVENLVIRIPYEGSSSNINVQEAENSDFKLENGEGITWNIPVLSAEDDQSSAKIEFTFANTVEEDDIFPVNMYFESPQTFMNINVRGVREVTNAESLKYTYNKTLQADKLFIE